MQSLFLFPTLCCMMLISVPITLTTAGVSSADSTSDGSASSRTESLFEQQSAASRYKPHITWPDPTSRNSYHPYPHGGAAVIRNVGRKGPYTPGYGYLGPRSQNVRLAAQSDKSVSVPAAQEPIIAARTNTATTGGVSIVRNVGRTVPYSPQYKSQNVRLAIEPEQSGARSVTQNPIPAAPTTPATTTSSKPEPPMTSPTTTTTTRPSTTPHYSYHTYKSGGAAIIRNVGSTIKPEQSGPGSVEQNLIPAAPTTPATTTSSKPEPLVTSPTTTTTTRPSTTPHYSYHTYKSGGAAIIRNVGSTNNSIPAAPTTPATTTSSKPETHKPHTTRPSATHYSYHFYPSGGAAIIRNVGSTVRPEHSGSGSVTQKQFPTTSTASPTTTSSRPEYKPPATQPSAASRYSYLPSPSGGAVIIRIGGSTVKRQHSGSGSSLSPVAQEPISAALTTSTTTEKSSETPTVDLTLKESSGSRTATTSEESASWFGPESYESVFVPTTREPTVSAPIITTTTTTTTTEKFSVIPAADRTPKKKTIKFEPTGTDHKRGESSSPGFYSSDLVRTTRQPTVASPITRTTTTTTTKTEEDSMLRVTDPTPKETTSTKPSEADPQTIKCSSPGSPSSDPVPIEKGVFLLVVAFFVLLKILQDNHL